ncbi:hypothetical protein SARC_08249 [Sphaeroforma arctica JP610]|uniref:Uncharacterized protein n=1 Tax=Sphaeroforma arctica JP610 TaxID=667725 RepID=A0A0L0FRA8_9EUKA|nr:hypothetical protein SARC_08249 [Sphaeroforma arctica JP610]KNC79357.1 hypothetical protein SARC_08249 [Sphaeroforma arctica JP610]|eukprot:XP_014153259.1 hypothetical protein SARC_08249 [Sphaeroforma arctica JP610]
MYKVRIDGKIHLLYVDQLKDPIEDASGESSVSMKMKQPYLLWLYRYSEVGRATVLELSELFTAIRTSGKGKWWLEAQNSTFGLSVAEVVALALQGKGPKMVADGLDAALESNLSHTR